MDNIRSDIEQPPNLSPQEWVAKEGHYRKLFETARDGILIVDAETGNVIDVNPFLIDALGYPRLDIINKPIWELGFLKKLFSDKNKFEELKQKDYLSNIDLPLETCTGVRLNAYLTGSSYEIEHRKLIQMHFQVLRERKEAESRLEESEQRFHQLIEEAPIGIALSQQGNTVYVNSKYLKMFGFEKAEELVGTSFLDQVAPQSRVEVIERAMQQEQGVSANSDYDIQGLRKDGSQFPFQASIARVELENGSALVGYFIDVTERKKAESNVKESEERFRHVFDMSPISAAITSPDLHFTRVNEQMCQMLGYTNNELMLLSVADITYPEDLPKDKEGISKLASGQIQQYVTDKRYVRKDGTTIWGHLSVSAVRDSEGQPVYFLPMIEDITERKQAEKELGSLSLFPAENPNPVMRMDSAGVIKYSNPACRQFGSEFDCSPGKIVPPFINAQIKKTLAAGRTDSFEFPIGTHVFNVVLTPITAGQYVNLYANDVTERVNADNHQKKDAERYQRLAESISDVFVAMDKDLRYTYWNKASAALTGVSAEDAIGKSFLEIFPDNPERQQLAAFYRRAIETRQPQFITIDYLGGQGLVHEISAYPSEEGVSVFIKDVTARNREYKENQILRDRSEISSRLAAIGEMSAGIAHEINNPLTGVIGFSELLLERTGLPDDVREELQIINDGSTRVKEIVSRLLMFARQTKPNKSSVSIAELLDNTMELRSYVLKTSNIEVIRDYDPDLPWVTADAGQLQQVFLNIIINAEYAMKKANGKGILTVKTESLDDHIRISISDDGPGMSDEIKAKLFQPFFTTKDPGEGTGLGLSLSRGIIQEHFGSIEVESVVGNGSTFIIELPITPVEIPPVAETPVAHINGPVKRARVLVVDDEPAVRSLIKAILTQDGHTVEECDNAEHVLEKLNSATFDILVVDLRMPGMNGMELYGEISTRWPKLAHAVIFITGDTSDLNTREYLATHQMPFIAKPFDRKTLESTVNAVLLGNPAA